MTPLPYCADCIPVPHAQAIIEVLIFPAIVALILLRERFLRRRP